MLPACAPLLSMSTTPGHSTYWNTASKLPNTLPVSVNNLKNEPLYKHQVSSVSPHEQGVPTLFDVLKITSNEKWGSYFANNTNYGCLMNDELSPQAFAKQLGSLCKAEQQAAFKQHFCFIKDQETGNFYAALQPISGELLISGRVFTAEKVPDYVKGKRGYYPLMGAQHIKRYANFQKIKQGPTHKLGEGAYAYVTSRLSTVPISSLEETLSLTELNQRDNNLPALESVYSLGQWRAYKTPKSTRQKYYHYNKITEQLPESPYLIRQTNCNGGIDMELAYTDLQKMGRDQQNKFIGYHHLGLLSCAGILRDIACALEALHKAGLAHRDVKPANVVMTPSGPKLCDFDFTRNISETNILWAGTPSYTAPEFIGKLPFKYNQCKGDIWALGVIVAEMILDKRWVNYKTPKKDTKKEYIEASVDRVHTICQIISKVSGPFKLLVPLAQSILKEDWQARPEAKDVASQLTAFCQRVTQWTLIADFLHKTLAAYYPINATDQKCQDLIQEGISFDEIAKKDHDPADYANHSTIHQTITRNCAPCDEFGSPISQSNLSVHQKRINFQETCLSILANQAANNQYDVFSPVPENMPMDHDQWQEIIKNLVTPSHPQNAVPFLEEKKISALVEAAMARYKKRAEDENDIKNSIDNSSTIKSSMQQ